MIRLIINVTFTRNFHNSSENIFIAFCGSECEYLPYYIFKMSKNVNKRQCELLLDSMKANKEIACGLTRQNKYKVASYWKGLTEMLNGAGPPVKSSFEWKKVWTDQKRYVRKKAVQNLQHTKGTGGGPNKQQHLTPSEEAIYSLIGTQEALGGVENANVFGIGKQVPDNVDCNPNVSDMELEFNLNDILPLDGQSDPTTDDCCTIDGGSTTYTPKEKKEKKLTQSDAVKEELDNQKELCATVLSISMNMETWHKSNNANARRVFKALEKANDLKERKLNLVEKHFRKMEELKKYKIESKLELSSKLLELEQLKLKSSK